MTADVASPKRHGLAVLWDVIVAPRTAFEYLRDRPQWGWAFVALCVLGIGGAFLQIPAGLHVVEATLHQSAATDPNFAAMSPEKQQQIVRQAQQIQSFSWTFFPVIAIISIAIAALIFLVGNAIFKGQGRFAQLFALAANVALINFGIGYLLIGVLTALHGPDAFSTQRDILTVLPSLAWVAPGGNPKVVTLLATFNPFQIWSFVLLAMGLGIIARIPRVPAYALAAIVSFGGILFAVPFAK